MNIRSDLKIEIEHCIGDEIIGSTSVSGGCIAESKVLSSSSGRQFFLKTKSSAANMFLNEANGLLELQKAKCIRIPIVLLADKEFLLLEYIPQGPKTNSFFSEFGKSFAQMHRVTSKHFGFYEDNYIGSNHQYNLANGLEKEDWSTFYFQKRILPQYKLALKNGYGSEKLTKGINNLEGHLSKLIGTCDEAPTLLHGDLWGGNYLCDSTGQAVLIDPACYYGHREADIAMTYMFGGFSPEFYASYQNEFPLAEGWQNRQGIYLLYHYFNHLNLFGRGYHDEVIRLLWQFI